MGGRRSNGGVGPVRLAQIKSRRELPRRFYARAEVTASDDGFRLELDGRPLETPAQRALTVPARALAELIRTEWAAQGERIDAAAMPVTRLVNTALDGVADNPRAVVDEILRFAATDLVCYRAEAPDGLVERQSALWDPVLDWADRRLGAQFVPTRSIGHVAQPERALNAVRAKAAAFDSPIALACLHTFTALTGSALMALSVAGGDFTAQQAFAAAHVDDDWNSEQWGEDGEAAARRARRWGEMDAAERTFRALRGL